MSHVKRKFRLAAFGLATVAISFDASRKIVTLIDNADQLEVVIDKEVEKYKKMLEHDSSLSDSTQNMGF